ncbi:magnesium/cobalt efflux protein, partial [Gardnerella vaginalis]
DSQNQSQNHKKNAALSDDEELENIQLDQAKASIDRLVEANDFDPEVSEMMRNVLTLSDTLTREIMVPRTDMICVKNDETLENFLKLCSRSGFSRVPIIGESVDDLEGIAYLKDAVRATVFNPAASERAVSTISRSPMLVPESKPVDDLFHEMQRIRQHVAVVVDEYGGIAGLVTIEDAIEQIVGELEDEHDRTQHADPQEVSKGVWKMPARTPIADLEDIFEVHIDEDDVDTVFGLLTKLLGNVPIVGSSAVTRGLKLTAVDSAGRRKKVSTILVERDIQGFKDIQGLKEDDSAGKSGGKSDSKADAKNNGKNGDKDSSKDSESSQVDGDK